MRVIGKFVVIFCAALALVSFTSAQQTAPPATPSASAAAPDFSVARKLMQQGKADEAIANLENIRQQNPDAKGVAFELGAAYYKKSDYPKAIESLKKAHAENPANDEATQLLGLSYYLSGNSADAIPLLEKVQSWFPRANVDASYILGMCYIQTRQYDQARHAFGKMFDVAPDSAAAYLFTARMLLRQDYEPMAEEYAQKAATLDPKLPLAHSLLGELYTAKSQIPEAIAEFEKELALNPANATIYYKLGDAYSREQKFDEAERVLQRSIWLDPSSTGPFILMGKVLQKKGEPALAVRTLEHAVTMDPNNATTHQLLGLAYRDLGKKEEAERELKAAQQMRAEQNAQ